LFWDLWIELPIERRVIEPLFTLYKDKEGYVNFGREYVKTKDPTGYKVAQKLLGGDYTHWTVLCGCKWFLAAKELWDRELDAALASEAMDEIRVLVREGMPAQKLAAAKFLATQGYRKKDVNTKGRPAKSDVERAARDLAMQEKDLEEDLKRIRGAQG
jgi:hypothetical protein